MFAAAIPKSTPWWHNLAFNWFDIALVLVLAFGFWRGRKRGMTKELLPTIQWLTILLCAGLGHVYLADWLQQMGVVKQVFGNHFNERTAARLSSYLAIMMLLLIVFSSMKTKFTSKLEGSNFFGGNEYYWGVVAGLVRYLCLLLVALALLNAPYYTPGDIAAIKAYKLNNYAGGGGVKGMEGDTGEFIPSVYEVQDGVFKHSFTGAFIKENLSMLLIISQPADPRSHREYHN
jgi:uncharacterized membrane protein required for colicin V production